MILLLWSAVGLCVDATTGCGVMVPVGAVIGGATACAVGGAVAGFAKPGLVVDLATGIVWLGPCLDTWLAT